MRRGFEASEVLTCQIVDRGLTLLERSDVVLEAAPFACRRRRLEAAQGEKRVASLEVAIKSFLQDRAEIVPDLGVSRGLLLCDLLELAEDAARDAFPDRRQNRAFLDHLAREIERQVG